MTKAHSDLFDVIVSKRVEETPTTVSLQFRFLSEEAQKNFSYKPGQFISLHTQIDGEPIKRSYSFSSAPQDNFIQTSIKIVPGGKMSSHVLKNIKEGDSFKISPAKGKFFTWPPKESPSSPQQMVLFGAGSGLVPMLSIAKWILETSSKHQVLLISTNQNLEENLFQKKWMYLRVKYKERFQVAYNFTRFEASYLNEEQDVLKGFPWDENILQSVSQKDIDRFKPKSNLRNVLKHALKVDDSRSLYTGRLNAEQIRSILDRFTEESYIQNFYICGPTEYMRLILDTLLSVNVPAECIHIESFFSKIRKSTEEDNPFKKLIRARQEQRVKAKEASKLEEEALLDKGIYIGNADEPIHPTEKIIVELDGETHTIDYVNGKSILEVIMDADLDPPYSCLAGACLSCLAKVKQGRVRQEELCILDKSNVKSKEGLMCQSYPVTKTVTICFE